VLTAEQMSVGLALEFAHGSAFALGLRR